jgi:hypothetical protein
MFTLCSSSNQQLFSLVVITIRAKNICEFSLQNLQSPIVKLSLLECNLDSKDQYGLYDQSVIAKCVSALV